ncbi:penicillin-binding transpeptidase domain-containing protein [uncultured Ferrimonas sp.]|uniref:peptidoglycan D,D-transpeptidase FtsI family protein n=1 Tax=uncultured Ferrimonas sp. TaxID=432640 RepID=UPI00260A5D35|nr:penicillin-binding transpeptidase domain-containing protein [uncultured Ferrimonas sp.]
MSRQGKRKTKPEAIDWRLMAAAGLIMLVFMAIVSRAAWIQVIEPERLRYEADMRTLRTTTTDVQRGMVTDRNGEMLAVSVPVMAAYADPKMVRDGNGFDDIRRWTALANVLEVNQQKLVGRVRDSKGRFVYLKRQVTPAVAEYIRKLKIPGIALKPESRRYYPAGEIAAQLIGITNIDDRGIEGLERNYNDWLTGSPAKYKVRKDRRGEIVENLSVVEEGENPNDLVLSLDMRLQSMAYTALKKATAYHMATSASLVIIDIPTGEVLAMANTPSYNPNSRKGLKPYQMRNRAITDAYEPGSVVKPLVVAAALDRGIVSTTDIIDTYPGYMRVRGGTVRDGKNLGKKDIGTLLVKSSNVGMTKMALQMEVDDLLAFYADFGLGTYSGISLDGEYTGNVPNRSRWSEHERATLAFGYGLTATPLQLARVYAILGAGGVSRSASILKRKNIPAGQRVLSEKTADDVVQMLTGVAKKNGTAPLAAIEGYEVAGKTGTSRKAVAGGYGEDYVTLFAGLAPANNPRLAMAVVVNEPKGDAYYGGNVAAPVFSEVMAGALQLLNVEPSSQQPRLAALFGNNNAATR